MTVNEIADLVRQLEAAQDTYLNRLAELRALQGSAFEVAVEALRQWVSDQNGALNPVARAFGLGIAVNAESLERAVEERLRVQLDRPSEPR